MAEMANVASGIAVAEIGALIGDVGRANMLHALMSGRALTAGELAWIASVSAPTASQHLARLTEAQLITVEKQGRHRYYRLSSSAVARMLEGISAVVATQGPARYRPASRVDDALKLARLCYDHLAGSLGVALADALAERGYLQFSEDGGVVTQAGRRFFRDFGVDLAALESRRRCFCRLCLDWSERRHHLAGSLGAAIASRCFDLAWIERGKLDRSIVITAKGRQGLAANFGFSPDSPGAATRG
jgi:DNA-binding transcriptional ArsR family regulator